jgi:hypothetical protein
MPPHDAAAKCASGPLIVLLQCSKAGAGMLSLDIADRTVDDWRAPAAAWLLLILFAALFWAATAVAPLHDAAARQRALAGADIPHHDPSLPGPDEIKASDWLEQIRAEQYSGM